MNVHMLLPWTPFYMYTHKNYKYNMYTHITLLFVFRNRQEHIEIYNAMLQWIQTMGLRHKINCLNTSIYHDHLNSLSHKFIENHNREFSPRKSLKYLFDNFKLGAAYRSYRYIVQDLYHSIYKEDHGKSFYTASKE